MKKQAISAVLAIAVAIVGITCSKPRQAQVAINAKPIGRVIVIGFDGLDPGLVRKWVGEGKLPTFERLISQGAFGDLWSVLPFSSASAWTSAMTGVNPGKHGIYGFLKATGTKTGEEMVFSSSVDRGFAPVWEIIGNYGLRSCIINIPLTSPADSLNGIMIAGFPHASEEKRAYYWPDTVETLLGDYAFDAFGVQDAESADDRFIKKMEGIETRRLDLGLRLFDKLDWDLFWLVFTFTDRYQHRMWKYMDKNHPKYDPINGPRYADAIERSYRMADEYLLQFINKMRPDDLLIVLSDHGFGHVYHMVNSTNFVNLTFGQSDAASSIVLTDFFGAKFQIRVSGPGADERFKGIRDRLIDALRNLKDPNTGANIIDSVYVREEIYKGPYLASAPHVIAIENPDYLFFTFPGTPDLRILDRARNPAAEFSGYHRRRGTIGVYGRYVSPGKQLEARITDIAAIIYAYLNVPAPSELDGRVPDGIFSEAIEKQTQLAYSDDAGYRQPVKVAKQDSKRVEKQLRAVGYMQ